MPDAVAVNVANAVVSVINAATLSQAFLAERNYADWDYELTALGTLRVDVCLVTTKQSLEPITRGRMAVYGEMIDVAVRKKLTRDNDGMIPNSQIDPLLLLIEEINELFLLKRLAGYDEGYQQGESKILQAPIPKHLREMTQFTGIVRLTFEAPKEIA